MSSEESKQVTVPASLDLVERAELGINGLLGSVDPDIDYEPFFLTFFAARPAYMIHWSSLVSGVMPKYVEALALLRNMTGSTQRQDIEDGLLESVLQNIADDGLIYDRRDDRRPWNVGVGYGKKSWNEDYSCLAGDGRLLCGMDWYHQHTGDELWKRQMKRTAERMLDLAVVDGEYAYYPNVGCGNDFSYPRESGWTHTNPPEGPQEGGEGATAFYLALPIRGWTRWYKISGDERMLDISRRFANFVMRPEFWGGVVETDPAYGAQRAHWWGHTHGTLGALRALLEYGLASDDYRVKTFVRDGYEWARHHLCMRLGLDAGLEGCTTGDLVALGIQLSDAGLGDFWDDVDHVVRNSLCEAQVADTEPLHRLGAVCPARPKDSLWGAASDWRFSSGILYTPLPGQECTDRVIERAVGGFSHLMGARYQQPMLMHCCTANGNQGFYYAWEAIVRYQDGTATINLLMNRFSPWLDIESYMPYEGKVIIKNKTARRIQVRIPAWVKRSGLRCAVNGNPVTPGWAGAYAVFGSLSGDAVLTIEFPLERETVTLMLPSMNQRQYRGASTVTATFKGSTCIGLEKAEESVHGMEPAWYPLFHRPQFQREDTPMKEVDYHVTEKPIRWY